MRRAVRSIVAAGAAAAAVVAAAHVQGTASAGGGPECREDDRLVVHEWGTFTSLQGSDGVALEGLEHEERGLPSFVYSRSDVRACPLRPVGWKGLEVEPTHVTQKMETPVLYVHSRSARRLRVRVDFARGLLSQWYPVTDLLGPPEQTSAAGPLDVSKVERSFLEWEVDVLPRGAERPAEVPEVADAEDPWVFAREVDANWLRTVERRAPRLGPVEAERYLFYRGLGAFQLPLFVEAERAGRATLILKDLKGLPSVPAKGVLALEVRGERARIQWIGEVASGKAVSFRHGGEDHWAPLADVVEKLEQIVHRELVAQGLRKDEATAMVRTWSASWFRSEGCRILWIVPPPVVESMLPLRIEPKPDEVVRVLLGRLEYLTPEDEDALERAVVLRTSEDPVARAKAQAILDRSGRFLEAHLRRVLERTTDPAAKAEARALLATVDRWAASVAPLDAAGCK
jgi:hypothetical protein